MKSSLKNGIEKNQVVKPSRSELIGFCIGMSSPFISLILPRMLVALVFIFLPCGGEFRAVRHRGDHRDPRKLRLIRPPACGMPGIGGTEPPRSTTRAVSLPSPPANSVWKASHMATTSGRKVVSNMVAMPLNCAMSPSFGGAFGNLHRDGIGGFRQRFEVGAHFFVVGGLGRHVGEEHHVSGIAERGELVLGLPIHRAVVDAAVGFDFEAVFEKGDGAALIDAGKGAECGFALADHAQQGFKIAGIAQAFGSGESVAQSARSCRRVRRPRPSSCRACPFGHRSWRRVPWTHSCHRT